MVYKWQDKTICGISNGGISNGGISNGGISNEKRVKMKQISLLSVITLYQLASCGSNGFTKQTFLNSERGYKI